MTVPDIGTINDALLTLYSQYCEIQTWAVFSLFLNESAWPFSSAEAESSLANSWMKGTSMNAVRSDAAMAFGPWIITTCEDQTARTRLRGPDSWLRDGGHHHNVTRWANGVAALGRANVVTESPHLVCLLLPRGSTSSRSTWALPFALLQLGIACRRPRPLPLPLPLGATSHLDPPPQPPSRFALSPSLFRPQHWTDWSTAAARRS